MKSIILRISFTLLFNVVPGQQTTRNIPYQDTGTFHFRNVAITMDTTLEDPSDHFRPEQGLKIAVTDNTFRLFYFSEHKKKKPNGVSMEFYLKANMPKEQERYNNNVKDGQWQIFFIHSAYIG